MAVATGSADPTRLDYLDENFTDSGVEEYCLSPLFASLSQHGDKEAVRSETGTFSYRQLEAESARLAAVLMSSGIGPESVVGLLVEPSIQMVVAVLAVLGSGAAYLPLDRRDPVARQKFILDDAGACALVLGGELEPPTGWTGLSVRIEADDSPRSPSASDFPRKLVRNDNAAYILYTSGSTGLPKGVVVTRTGLANYLCWAASFYQQSRTRSIVCTGLSFDLTITSLLVPLYSGGALHIAGDDIDALERSRSFLLEDPSPSLLKLTPTHLKLMAAALQELPVAFEGDIVVGGETFRGSDIPSEFFRPGLRIFNEYGPTEATVGCTSGQVESKDASGMFPVGSPIGNMGIMVLDEHLECSPAGATGEIFISGPGLARGYGSSTGLTADRFLANPFGQPGSRMYRSGDLGRWRPDGQLEVVGRKDEQVKIRGHRIELEEIESALNAHQYVAQSAVTGISVENSDSRLIAFWVPRTKLRECLDDVDFEDLATVAEWQSIQDHVYTDLKTTTNSDFTGWDSSFTGRQISTAELETWLDHTVDAILSLKPRLAMEIGCGIGNVLTRVAPHCASYVGSELSGVGVAHLLNKISSTPCLSNAIVHHADALAAFSNVNGLVDTVILNSVIHHFPSKTYLQEVLDEAVLTTTSGGRIFIGDVRALELLDVFHTAVELEKSSPDMAISEVKIRAGRAFLNEEELLVSPSFFRVFSLNNPRISAVEINLKRGYDWNELVRYRFDVVLHVDGPQAAIPAVSIDWEPGCTIAALLSRFEGGTEDVVEVRSIPNARLVNDLAQHQNLRGFDAKLRVAEFKRTQYGEPDGVEPEDVWREVQGRGWRASLSPRVDRPDHFDLVLSRRPAAVPTPSCRPQARDVGKLTNDPFARGALDEAGRRLKAHLRDRVPVWMQPEALIVLRELPMTRSGKVDRQALFLPVETAQLRQEQVGPATDAERVMASIWEKVLGHAGVFRDDDFFDIGGQSLLATTVISLVQKEFRVKAPLRMLFEERTLSRFTAEVVRAAEAVQA